MKNGTPALAPPAQAAINSEAKASSPIYVTQPFLPPLDEFTPYLQQIWANKVLTNGGPFHQQLEQALCDYLGVSHVALFSNGTLALITADTPVIAVATQDAVSSKMYSNIQEVKARGAEVLGIGYEDDKELGKYTTETVRIPRVDFFIAPILSVIPMQLLAYYTSVKRGNDVDKPRNLAKSVTVE